MSLNCRLNRNISLIQYGESSSGDGCNSQDITMGVGGIQSPVYIYNLDDVVSLKFKNDNRADDSLEVDTINATNTYYKVDFTTATYTEDYDNGKWTHQLQLEVGNITQLFEDILSDAVNGKYLVCFRPKGAEDYRMFGWQWGASLDYQMNVQEDSYGYTITFDDESEYPLFTVYKENFGEKGKTYTPVFVPTFKDYICEIDNNGYYTGYKVSLYVEKQNSARQALDINNQLCMYSGLKQAAYKYEGTASDGNYQIIGTYGSDGVFDGRPVKELDRINCVGYNPDSIWLDGLVNKSVRINSTSNTATTVQLMCGNDWHLMDTPSYCRVTPVASRALGQTAITISYDGGRGGTQSLRFQNDVTHGIATLTVDVCVITVASVFTYPYGTTEFVLTPVARGGDNDYTYSTDISLNITKDGNGYLICRPNVTPNQQVFVFTLKHSTDPTEVKTVTVTINGNSTNPTWQLLESYCETEDGNAIWELQETYCEEE